MAISTNGTIITRLAGALYGEYLSNASYAEVSTTAPAAVASNWLSNDFASKTDLQLANTVLSNLGLTSIAGLNNWLSAQLTAAGSTSAAKGAKLVSILNDFSQMSADATYGSYATAFNANTAASLAASQKAGSAIGSFATSGAIAAAAATAAAAAAVAAEVAAKVIADAAAAKVIADVAAAKVTADAAAAKVISDAAAAAVAPQKFALTIGVDNGADFTGKGGSDIYTATTTSTGLQTLTAGDVLSGGDGADTLQITTTAISSVGTGVITTSIETISATATVGTLTVDASTMAGVTNVTNSGSTAAVIVTGLATIPVVNITATNVDTTVTETAVAVAGATDAMTINLNGAGTTANVNINVDGIEILNVAANGTASGGTSSTVSLVDTAAVTTLNVTGTAGAKLAVNLSGATATVTGIVTSADGSDDVAITADATDKLSVNMGPGNDKVRISNIAATHTIDGGAGTDTLISTAAITVVTGANISGFEAVSVGAVSVALPVATNTLSAVTFTGTGGSVTGLATGGVITQVAGGTNTVVNTGWTGAADALTVNFGTATSTTLTAQSLTATLALEEVTINNLQLSTDVSTRTVGATGDALKTINVVSNGSAPVIIAGGGAALTKVNAAGVTGAVTISTNVATAGAALTGGAGNDVITGGVGADTIVGGEGNDTITGNQGADNLTGGAGVDTFSFALNSAVTGTAQISGAVLTDTITDFVTGTDKLNIAQVTSFLGNYSNLTTGLAGVATAAAGGVAAGQAFFSIADNTLYVNSTNTAALAGTDTIIKFGTSVTGLTGTDFTTFGTQGAGVTIALTGTSQTVSNTAAVALQSTTGNDLINSTAAFLASSAIDGGLGVDTLTLSDTTLSGTQLGTWAFSGVAGAGVTPLTSIEVVNLVNGSGGIVTGPAYAGIAINNTSATLGSSVTLGAGANQSFTATGAGSNTVVLAAGLGQSATITGAFGVANSVTLGGTGQTVTIGAGTNSIVVPTTTIANGSTISGSSTGLLDTLALGALGTYVLGTAAATATSTKMTGIDAITTVGATTLTLTPGNALTVTPDDSSNTYSNATAGATGTVTLVNGPLAATTTGLSGVGNFTVTGHDSTGLLTNSASGTVSVTTAGATATTFTSTQPMSIVSGTTTGGAITVAGAGAYTLTTVVAGVNVTQGTGETGAVGITMAASTGANTFTSVAGGGAMNVIAAGLTAGAVVTIAGAAANNTTTVTLGALDVFTGVGGITHTGTGSLIVNEVALTVAGLAGFLTGSATGLDTWNLAATGGGVSTIVGTGGLSNPTAIDTVSNFKVSGADVFKNGVAATTLNNLVIATADITTLSAAIGTAAVNAGATLAANTQAYLITVNAGTAAGTYAFQNLGADANVTAADFMIKLIGTQVAIVVGDFIV